MTVENEHSRKCSVTPVYTGHAANAGCASLFSALSPTRKSAFFRVVNRKKSLHVSLEGERQRLEALVHPSRLKGAPQRRAS